MDAAPLSVCLQHLQQSFASFYHATLSARSLFRCCFYCSATTLLLFSFDKSVRRVFKTSSTSVSSPTESFQGNVPLHYYLNAQATNDVAGIQGM
jgi:hypothetical protein